MEEVGCLKLLRCVCIHLKHIKYLKLLKNLQWKDGRQALKSIEKSCGLKLRTENCKVTEDRIQCKHFLTAVTKPFIK